MGEDPAAVENVGGLGDENLRSLPLLSRAALAESIGFGLERPYALVTYHPETAGGASPAGWPPYLPKPTRMRAAPTSTRGSTRCARRAPDSMSPLPAWAYCGTFRP